ncbi:MAG TPA: Asp-tRNA(Asn)/Glu-tRNA(Gln) amidotransferase subunit GatC [Candidatus Fimivivens faecavium]|nr:Asp-tRNA(Asn)/Glu-tRNA(Gln) amidotransferase subunit GatC [Candidatus Fimivivens faecavium]
MVTREEIYKIAVLSKLSVDESELDELTKDMEKIIAFADTVNAAAGDEADEFDNINGLKNVFRPDEVVPSYPQERILQNVNGGENGYFPVKKRM